MPYGLPFNDDRWRMSELRYFWRTANPGAGIRLTKGKRAKGGVWEQTDVDAYVAAAEDLGLVSIAGNHPDKMGDWPAPRSACEVALFPFRDETTGKAYIEGRHSKVFALV